MDGNRIASFPSAKGARIIGVMTVRVTFNY